MGGLAMEIFHKHFFQLKGNSLWCKCGEIKNIPCLHKWKIHKEQSFREGNIMSSAYQDHVIQILICENCGEIKTINII